MKRDGAKERQRAQDSRAQDTNEADGEQAAPSAILHSVAIVSDKRFRLDIELRHQR